MNKIKAGIRISIKIYFSIVSISILVFSCIFSTSITIGAFLLFFKGEFTPKTTIIVCFIICSLTILIGGCILWKGTGHLIRPLQKVNDAVKKVACGNFNVTIERNIKLRGNYQYANELDELSVNFNKMTSELNKMDYMRKDFISNVSHEIKTPVAAISGFTELLMEDNLSKDEEREYLSLVNEEAFRLSVLCENMLMLSRLDNQSIVKKEDSILVDEQIRKAVIIITEKWKERELNFQLNLDENELKSNKVMLFQVWINLIDNAVKYSKVGSTIFIREFKENSKICVEIRDEGVGIPKDKISKIFDKFYQCEESHKRIGNGLGLAIVKRIVELLSGTISCHSEVNQGTTFTIWL